MERIEFRGHDCDFQAWLAELKARGSNLLVTGDVPPETSAVFGRAMFGRGRRKRVLALTDSTVPDADAHLPEGVTPTEDDCEVIDQRKPDRAASAAALVSATDYRRLRADLVTAISHYDEVAGGLDAAELRLGFDALDVAPREDRTTIRRFLRAVTATVRGVRGMGHYHLRLPDDDPAVTELDPLFDARIELRKGPSGPAEQRWHVPEHGETTNWVSI